MAEAAQRGGDNHQVGGYEAPQSVCDATAAWVGLYAPKGGSPTKHTKRGPEMVVVEADAPSPLGVGPHPLPQAVDAAGVHFGGEEGIVWRSGKDGP